MNILDMYVNWMPGTLNDPYLEVLIDALPDFREMIYEEKNDLFFAEKDGYVRFYYRSKNQNGYGGSVFKLPMKDGTTVKLVGPWSSRSGCANKLGFKPCSSVGYTTDPDKFKKGRLEGTGHMTVEKLNVFLPIFLPKVHLRRIIQFDNDEPYYLPNILGVAKEQTKIIGADMYPPRKSHQYVRKVTHISKPLKEYQDDTARLAFKMTKEEAHEHQVCISCKLPVLNRIESELGWKEYGISALCEICWDTMFKEHIDGQKPWRP